MNKLLIKTLAAVLVLSLSSLAEACAGADRTVELHITVLDPDQKPVEALGVCTMIGGELKGAPTNSAGVATLPLSLPDKETRVALQFRLGCGGKGAVIRRVTSQLVTRVVYWVEVPAGAMRAELTIQLERAVKVSGRFRNDKGLMSRGTVALRDYHAMSPIQTDGRFVLPVKPNSQAEAHFHVEQGRIWSVPFAVKDADVDLGDIDVEDVPSDAVVRLVLADGNLLPPTHEDRRAVTTLISVDGKVIRSFVNKNNTALGNSGPDTQPKVPAGTYYVTPGLFGNTPSFKVLDLIRAGRQAELDKAGVPKIVAVADKETALTISVPEAEAAFEALPTVPDAWTKSEQPKKPEVPPSK